jgi:hypothetical protein
MRHEDGVDLTGRHLRQKPWDNGISGVNKKAEPIVLDEVPTASLARSGPGSAST